MYRRALVAATMLWVGEVFAFVLLGTVYNFPLWLLLALGAVATVSSWTLYRDVQAAEKRRVASLLVHYESG